MNRQLILNDLMKDEIERCTYLRDEFNEKISILPEGSISIKNGKYYRNVRIDGKQFSVQIRDDDLVRKLRERKYIAKGMASLEQHIKACECYLERNKPYDPYDIAQNLKTQYRDLQGVGVFLSNDINLDEWMNAQYKSNPMTFKEKHYTMNGITCRSKSEALIGTCLEQENIAYRYEPELILNGKVVYPDFEILLPNRRVVVYYEHFGLVEDADYAWKTLRKIEMYSQAGIYTGRNLFYTYERQGKPLNMLIIKAKIKEILALDEI